jgi:hypothetical protein
MLGTLTSIAKTTLAPRPDSGEIHHVIQSFTRLILGRSRNLSRAVLLSLELCWSSRSASRLSSSHDCSFNGSKPQGVCTGSMSVLLETSAGDIVIDLLVDHAPKLCEK